MLVSKSFMFSEKEQQTLKDFYNLLNRICDFLNEDDADCNICPFRKICYDYNNKEEFAEKIGEIIEETFDVCYCHRNMSS